MSTSLGLSEAATRQVVSEAGMAPSLFNTQPWRFRLRPDRIEVHADLGRRLAAHDPEDRELRIACGAALFNLRLALHAHGVTPVVTVEPGDLPGALAVVRRGPVSVRARDDAALHRAISQRRTNRRPFLNAPMPDVYRRVLTYAAAAEGADLRTITTPVQRFRLRCLITGADQRQRADVVCRAEMDAWTGYRNGHLDGVPLAAAGPQPAEPQHAWASRDMGNRFGGVRSAEEHVENEPFIVVLSTRTDGPGCQVGAGQALQRLLLTATALGLSASFLSQPIEVNDERAELRRLLADDLHPQAVLRLGFSEPAAPTPRRDAADLLLPEHIGSTPGAGTHPVTQTPSPSARTRHDPNTLGRLPRLSQPQHGKPSTIQPDSLSSADGYAEGKNAEKLGTLPAVPAVRATAAAQATAQQGRAGRPGLDRSMPTTSRSPLH